MTLPSSARMPTLRCRLSGEPAMARVCGERRCSGKRASTRACAAISRAPPSCPGFFPYGRARETGSRAAYVWSVSLRSAAIFITPPGRAVFPVRRHGQFGRGALASDLGKAHLLARGRVSVSAGGEPPLVMAAVQTAMLDRLPYPRLRDAVIAHLTIAEGLGPLSANVAAAPGAIRRKISMRASSQTRLRW
jgi:hypothetical protein